MCTLTPANSSIGGTTEIKVNTLADPGFIRFIRRKAPIPEMGEQTCYLEKNIAKLHEIDKN